MTAPVAPVNGFRHVKNVDELPEKFNKHSVIEGYQIYHSDFNESFYIIHDEEKELYHQIEDISEAPQPISNNLEKYVKFYKNINQKQV